MGGVNSRVGSTFGKYRIDGLLGKGGMGEVYQAFDTDKGRTVALKILAEQLSHDERFRTRFLRESHAAAILQEPHVIPIHDWGEIDGSMYIDMRLVQGQTLHDLLSRGPLEPARAVTIIGQIASALDAAHAERLIHRDVKPQNIIVTSADFAYLVDFGIAEAKGDTHLTMTGTAVGSYAYMAPERYLDQEVTPAVDVYALACVLYEALTGNTPFPADSLEHIIGAHISSPPPRPSAVNRNVPPSFDDVIARGMAKDPDDRYGSAGGLGRAAQRALRADWRVAPDAATMAAPQPAPQVVTPRQVNYGWATPPPPPTAPANTVAGQWDSRSRSRPWVLPAIIAAVAALLLGSIGVIIGLLAQPDSSPSPGPAPTPSYGATDETSGSENTTPSKPATPTALPPPATGQDPSPGHEVCNEDYVRAGATGQFTHARRGNNRTSCAFTRNVLNTYWDKYGRPTPTSRTLSVPGSVSCPSTGSSDCDGNNFWIRCEPDPSQDWLTCTGGDNAVIYLF